MLLTLSTRSFQKALGGRHPKMSLLELPRFAKDELGLQGLNVHTTALKGWSIAQIDQLRDEADKAGCPCLLLMEDIAHTLGGPATGKAGDSSERMQRVLRVANRLGCSGVTMSMVDARAASAMDEIIERLKSLVNRAERLEINLLLAPNTGITEQPAHLTELIRKVGGFRIGSFPDFETAAATEDPDAYLRGLTPYASAVSISSSDFDTKGKHPAFDFHGCLGAITAVGYDGTVSLEYRGTKDPAQAIIASRESIEAHLETLSA